MAEKSAKKPNFFVRVGRGISRFFRDTRGEMKKVVWPSRKQVRNNVIVVLIFVVLAAIIIFALDIAFDFILRKSLEVVGNIGAEGDASSVVSSAAAALKLPFFVA